MNKKEIQGHLCGAVTIVIWGTTFISTKLLLKSFSPVEILIFRFVIGFCALWLVDPHRLSVRDRRQELYFAAAGFCGITLYYLLENVALTYTSASVVGVIISIAPFFTAAGAHLFLKGERLHAGFFTGFTAALAGVCLISFDGWTVQHLNPLGSLLAVSAAVVWALYSIITKKISTFGYTTIRTTRRTFFYGLIFLVPVSCFFGLHPDWKALSRPVNICNILFLGLGASALCFVTWNTAVRLLGAVRTSMYIYLVPVITVGMSALILGERITPAVGLGMVLTLGGLCISEQTASGGKIHKKRIQNDSIR